MCKMTRRTMFLRNDFWAKIEELATKEGTTLSDLVRRAVYEFLQKRGLVE